ncbi:MAG: prepilin peptidase [Deltaproteobacteria bacterium]|jgi:prepilin peptidase CpaA|nr:prepilin peptidase [Deltaproteobacteria bacterium]
MLTQQEAIGHVGDVNALPRDLGRSVIALGISALVTTCFLWSAAETPLPHTIGAAAFLAAAVFTDVRWMKIPNALTFPALALALVYVLAEGGASALVDAFSGAALALLLFGAAFAFGWMGAGDVKATMVLGVLWGPATFAATAWWMIVAGGILAIAVLGLHPSALFDLMKRWAKSAWYSLRLRRVVYLPPHSDSPAKGLPFAIAMGLGASCAQIWGSPWA